MGIIHCSTTLYVVRKSDVMETSNFKRQPSLKKVESFCIYGWHGTSHSDIIRNRVILAVGSSLECTGLCSKRRLPGEELTAAFSERLALQNSRTVF
jgi:hypothetical protein